MADDSPTEVVTVTAERESLTQARQPRALIKVGPFNAESVTDGWIEWTVSNNSFYEADTFSVSFAVSKLPNERSALWFSQQKELFVEIFAGFPSDPEHAAISELASLIYGRVDEIQFDPCQTVIRLTGRDLTAAFIDAKLADQYINRTASEIATNLARSHGITPSVSATSARVGTYYEIDQVHLEANRSEWDLLAYLARREAFVVYVQGQTLFFQPDPTSTQDPFDIAWQTPTDTRASPLSNVAELNFSRALTVAKGISVTARSPNLLTGRPVVQSYPSAAKGIQAGKASPFGGLQNYVFNMSAGHLAVEVQAYAKHLYDEIVAHEMKLSASLPADPALTMQTPIRVSGTGTDFDQIYYPRLITREMNLDEGYRMTVEAQNVNPDTNPAT
jgi:phage protein D